MTTPIHESDTATLWGVVGKEITGIQLLWEAVECLYFKRQGQGLAGLAQHMPLLYGLMLTTLMESLLMRTSRLMDPATSGRGNSAKNNLSLKRLEETCGGDTATDVKAVRDIWDASNLKHIRDKYQSHNDLNRSLREPHTLNVPLDEADIAALRNLVSGLRDFRRKVHCKLHAGTAYLDGALSLQVQREIDGLDRSVQGSMLFFKLLPKHEALQHAWGNAISMSGGSA